MASNRFKNRHSLHWAAVMKWIAVVMMVSVLGVSYVLMKNQILRLATEVKDQETELANWKRRNSQLDLNIARVTSPQELQRRVNGLGIGLVRLSELEVHAMEQGSGRMESTSRIASRQSGESGGFLP